MTTQARKYDALAIVVCLLVMTCATAAFAADGPPATTQPSSRPDLPAAPAVARFEGQVLGNIDKGRFPEPSGIVFHPARKTLFVVGDGGDLCEMKTDGTVLGKKHYADLKATDFEGITVNPASGLLYVAVEGAEAILEISPDDLAVRRQFTIERTFNGKTVMAAGGQGIEAITFIPNPKHADGGTFLVANQAFTLNDPQDVSAVFEVEIPLADKTGKPPAGKLLRQFSLGVTDLSDMHYDAARDRLFIISDANDLMFVTTLSGRVITKYTNLPCADQEGIAFDGAGNMYIGQDSGGVVKVKWSAK